METGKKYKLADECITPGGRNMDKMEQRIEQIEKFASQCYEDGGRYSAFISGAIWADNNPPQDIVNLNKVWHDANIVPSENKGIIYLTKNNKLGVFNSIKSNNWDWYVSGKYSIIKWAYSSDLLPKGGER